MEKTRITVKHIIRQLMDDLIGKDSYRGVTFTYSWMANQFGHFALGYIPTLFVFTILAKYTSFSSPVCWSALIVSAIWLLFEIYNFLGPLLARKSSDTQFIYIPSKASYVFQPDWKNVAFDTLTDLLFFWFGAFLAALFLKAASPADATCPIIPVPVCLFLAFLYPSYYWFTTKIYLQYAQFPIQLRLSQWRRNDKTQLPAEEVKIVTTFISECLKGTGNHLLISGGRRSGKSLLGIGIGTELSIKRVPVSYYTVVKWFNLLSLNDADTREAENSKAWTWRTASVLIVDDINPGRPVPTIFMSPKDVLTIINTPVDGNPDANKKAIKDKNVIWVLGDEASGYLNDWRDMLLNIGVREDKIKTIGLGFSQMQL